MKIPASFCIQLTVAVLIAGTAKGGSVSPGTVLGPSFNYILIGAPVFAGGGPSVPNPGVDVSLNPQPLPPFPDPGASLDLTNPSDPLYTYPPNPAAGLETFLIGFGMDTGGGAVSFGPLTPTPGDPLNFTLNATDLNGDAYVVTLMAGGFNPGSFVELNPQPLPPFPDPNFSFIVMQGTAGGDPTLQFSVTSGSTTFAFTDAPEPSSLVLVPLAGLLAVLRRRPVRRHTAGR